MIYPIPLNYQSIYNHSVRSIIFLLIIFCIDLSESTTVQRTLPNKIRSGLEARLAAVFPKQKREPLESIQPEQLIYTQISKHQIQKKLRFL